jgi:hypothetical protein
MPGNLVDEISRTGDTSPSELSEAPKTLSAALSSLSSLFEDDGKKSSSWCGLLCFFFCASSLFCFEQAIRCLMIDVLRTFLLHCLQIV